MWVGSPVLMCSHTVAGGGGGRGPGACSPDFFFCKNGSIWASQSMLKIKKDYTFKDYKRTTNLIAIVFSQINLDEHVSTN